MVNIFATKNQCYVNANSYFTTADSLYRIGDYKNAAIAFEKSAKQEKECTPFNIVDYAFEMYNAAVCYKISENYEKSYQTFKSLFYENQYSQIDSVRFESVIAALEIAYTYTNQEISSLIKEAKNEAQNKNRKDILCRIMLIETDILIDEQKNVAALYIIDSCFDISTNLNLHTIPKAALNRKHKLVNIESIGELQNQSIETLSTDNGHTTIEDAELALNIAKTYAKLQLLDSSIIYAHKAVDYFNKVGNHSGLGMALNTRGKLLLQQNKPEEAFHDFTVAKNIYTSINDPFGIAVSLNLIGNLYKTQSNYEIALENYEKAYEISINNNYLENAMLIQNNIGNIYLNQGQYHKAIEYYQTSLHNFDKEKHKKYIGIAKNNIGSVYAAWAHWDKALIYFNSAIEIYDQIGEQEQKANTFNNIGGVKEAVGDYSAAMDYYNKSIEIFYSLLKNREIAVLYNNIGSIYFTKGESDKALEYYTKSQEISRSIKDISQVAVCLDNIGNVYSNRGQTDSALVVFTEALEIRRKLNEKGKLTNTLNNLAVVYINNKEYDKGIELLEESISIIESLRTSAQGAIKRDYFQKQIYAYENLIVANIYRENIEQAFYFIELSRAKTLSEQLSQSTSMVIPTLEDVQSTLEDGELAIIFSTVNNNDISLLCFTNTNVEIRTINKENFIRKLLQDVEVRKNVVASIDYSDIPRLKSFWQDNTSIATDKAFVRTIFANAFQSYIEMLNTISSKSVQNMNKYSKSIYNLLLGDVDNLIGSANKIIIMQDGILSYVPFETLLDKQGKYLIEDRDISYINSFSIDRQVSQRHYSDKRKSICAFGVSQYSAGKCILVQEFETTLNFKEYVYSKMTKKDDMTDVYSYLGLCGFSDLKGSNDEIENIRTLFPSDSYILKDSLVSESIVKGLSQSGSLKKYRIIHFSTHGVASSEIPELSALVLSPAGNKTDDNYLRMEEISDLQLNADFVNLSACETGLGKLYSGEGVVGLARSFIVAGANSLSVSLWQVDDESTSVFMLQLYQIAKENGYNMKESIAEVKQDFIKGKYNFTWTHPYFWAPFVYYGR